MKDIIQWLLKIEHTANDIYSRSAVFFRENNGLMNFLIHAAEDEAWHCDMMAYAAQNIKNGQLLDPSIAVDRETKEKIEKIFRFVSQRITDQTLTEETLLEKIVEAEFSEWNDIFLYVIDALKKEGDEFKLAVKKIQSHLRSIMHFLETKKYGPKLLEQLKTIPPVWTERILIVDDEELASQLIRAILNKEGNIDIAVNGKEALEKIKQKYYRLIISDVDMPVMNGVSFYKHAVELFPGIKDRFLFISGGPSQETLDFFKKNDLKLILKPAPINEIRNEALRILLNQEDDEKVLNDMGVMTGKIGLVRD